MKEQTNLTFLSKFLCFKTIFNSNQSNLNNNKKKSETKTQ